MPRGSFNDDGFQSLKSRIRTEYKKTYGSYPEEKEYKVIKKMSEKVIESDDIITNRVILKICYIVRQMMGK